MKRSVLIGLICFSSGILLGYYAKQRSIKNDELADGALSSCAIISRNIATLRCFYDGNSTQAIMLLRSSTTINTMLLEGFLSEMPPNRRNSNCVRWLDQSKKFMSNTNL